MGYDMNLNGYLVGYKIELDQEVPDNKGGTTKHEWKTIRLEFPSAEKKDQQALRLAAERFILTLNETYVVLVAEILDGLSQNSELYEIKEYF